MVDIDNQDRRGQSWHIDKSISVPLIVFLVLHTVSVIWFFAKLDSRIEEQEAKITEHSNKLAAFDAWKEGQDGIEAKTESRLAVIEERTAAQSDTLRRIDDRTEKMITGKRERQ